MSSDTLVYDMASSSEGSASVFVKKDWLNILDNQNGAYAANQSVIDTSQLANSNKYMNYREAYLAVPMLLTATSGKTDNLFQPATAATSADFAFGLKNWFGSIIHSMTLDLAGTTIIQQTPYSGLWNSFKLMTSLSWGDVATIGSSIGFYPDNPLSVSFIDSTSGVDGTGICNNRNAGAFPVVSAAFNSYDVTNDGFLKRQQYINYDADGLTAPSSAAYSTLLTSAACANLYKSHITTKTNSSTTQNGIFQVSIMAIIQLKHIHSFFQNVPLLKGVYMRMTLNLNQPTVTASYDYNSAADELWSSVSVSSPLGGVSPIMLASASASNGAAALGTSDAASPFTISLAVGNRVLNTTQAAMTGIGSGAFSPNINLYVPAYTFNPVYEQAYLSSPVKRIVYTDIYQYQVPSVAAGATFNQLITNGIAGLKSVLVLPFYTAAENAGLDPIQSPFCGDGCGTTSPLCLLNNFNVVVSGQNMIYNTQKYSYEQYMNQLYGVNAVNGGLTDGLTSGLFNQLGFEMEYCYHYVNCSRMLPVEEPVPKSVSIIGQNQSAQAIQLYVFCEYGVEISVDVLTGARV